MIFINKNLSVNTNTYIAALTHVKYNPDKDTMYNDIDDKQLKTQTGMCKYLCRMYTDRMINEGRSIDF